MRIADAKVIVLQTWADPAARFPYRRAYLAVNRNLDGTTHDW
ncbi:MAG TPA: hypothetical protein VI488_19065 [Candidatus Angelobacter sp.]